MNAKEIITLVGGVLGILAFAWKLWDTLITYAIISAEVSQDDNGNTTILTKIDNKSNFSKDIKFAFLLIGPEEENCLETAKRVAEGLEVKIEPESFQALEQLYSISDKSVYVDGKRAFIPLTFYYREQRGVGDEVLSYRCSIKGGELAPDFYSVRFFVQGRSILGIKRWYRSCQDLFHVKRA